jgi:DNA polymerase-3 subunit epsilon
MPAAPFTCTVKLARERWGIYPTKLPDVARHLGVELRHHEALSDAVACARIVVEAEKTVSAY